MTDTAQAPATTPAPATTAAPTKADAKPAKKAVAKHELLAADGQTVVENEEDARGIRYTLLANNKSFTYMTDAAGTSARDRMLAIFGAKTLATNETSQVRNNPKTKLTFTPDECLAAVVARFALLDTGKWVDRTREGGPQIDIDALASAIVDVIIASGKSTEADRDSLVDARLDKLATDEAYCALMKRAARGDRADVAAAYATRIGRTAIADDQL